jgi:RNA polymerase sigma-70 factor, ECF subfamily
MLTAPAHPDAHTPPSPHPSWEHFYACYHQRLFSFIQRSIACHDDAEDLVQESMLAAYKAAPQYDGRAQPFTWLCGIARHKVADYQRSRRLTLSLPATLPAPEASGPDMLREELGPLPEGYWEVLLLRYYAAFPVGEVAVLLGRSYKSTESLLSRARAQARALSSTNIARVA